MTPLTSPTTAATSMTTRAVSGVMCIATGNPMPGRDMALMTRVPSSTPTTPPIREMAIDSLKSSLSMFSRVKPTVAERQSHRVGAGQQGGEDHRSANAEDEYFDAAETGDEVELERLFALAL